jgi:sodium/hydrogen antiporter
VPPAVTTASLAAMLALIGAVIAVSALLSGFVDRTRFPQVAVFLLLGALVGPSGLGLLEIGLDSPVLRVVGTLSLALVLFTDALGLSLGQVRKNAGLAVAILGPGTLLATVVIALAGRLLLGLPWTHAAILAAALASTDPVLLRGLLRHPKLPGQARLALQLESGLNDVVLLPIVLVAMAFALPVEAGHGVDVPGMLLRMLVLGPGAGVVVAAVAIGALERVRQRTGVRRDYESIYSLGVCFAAFAAAEALHGSGFLAAFAAGLTISALSVEMCDCFKEYGETTAEMLLMFTFVLLGGSLVWRGLGGVTFAVALFAVLALAARPAALLAVLAPLRIDARAQRTIAWFGPRGLSTLLLVLVPVFDRVPGTERLFDVSSVVVLVSILLHGASIMRFAPTPPVPKPVAEPVRAASDEAASEGETILPAEVSALLARGEDVRLVDVRSDRSYLDSDEDLRGSLRLDLNQSVRSAEASGLPREAWIALYCTCPSEQTSLRVARELRTGGWSRAVAVVGGWDALRDAGFESERRA